LFCKAGRSTKFGASGVQPAAEHLAFNFVVVFEAHTAVGLNVAERVKRNGVPLLSLANAHPAKFDSAIRKALPGVEVNHPTLQALVGMPTRKTVLDVDVGLIKQFIESGGTTG